MKTPLTFLLSLTFLFLFSGCVYGDDLQDATDAYKRKDYETAYKLFLPLAELDIAQSFLGVMYEKGQGVPQDYKEAVKWYLLSAEQGNILGQVSLGSMFKTGRGVTQNYKEAVKWYRLSAEKGVAIAQFFLGLMYGNGKGVIEDYKEAVKWYRLSAEQGHTGGARFLGRMYAKGTGVLKDYALAHMWWNICGSSGDKDCVKSRDKIEQIMTPSQIEKAQDMARNWKPTK
jgi:uncharacterized protein